MAPKNLDGRSIDTLQGISSLGTSTSFSSISVAIQFSASAYLDCAKKGPFVQNISKAD